MKTNDIKASQYIEKNKLKTSMIPYFKIFICIKLVKHKNQL